MIMLSDPNNFQCSKEEQQLLEAAALTHDAINPLGAADADFMMRHREQIQSFLAHSSTAVGAGETMLATNQEPPPGCPATAAGRGIRRLG